VFTNTIDTPIPIHTNLNNSNYYSIIVIVNSINCIYKLQIQLIVFTNTIDTPRAIIKATMIDHSCVRNRCVYIGINMCIFVLRFVCIGIEYVYIGIDICAYIGIEYVYIGVKREIYRYVCIGIDMCMYWH